MTALAALRKKIVTEINGNVRLAERVVGYVMPRCDWCVCGDDNRKEYLNIAAQTNQRRAFNGQNDVIGAVRLIADAVVAVAIDYRVAEAVVFHLTARHLYVNFQTSSAVFLIKN